MITLPGKKVQHTLHVAGRKVINPQAWLHIGIFRAQARRASSRAGRVHMLEQSADVLGNQISSQGPGCIDVSEGDHQIWHIREHQAFIGPGIGKFYRLPVDTELHATQHFQIEPGGGDNDIGLQLPAGLQSHTLLGEGVNMIRHHFHLTGPDRLEQVTVRYQT